MSSRVAAAAGILDESSALTRRYRTAAYWNTVAMLAGQGSTLLANVLVANMLGRERFGELALVLSTVQMLTLIAGLAMGYTATKYIAEYRVSDPARAGRIAGFCAVVSISMAAGSALLLAALAPTLAEGVLGHAALAPSLRWAAFAVLFAVLNGFLTGVLSGMEAFNRLGMVGIVAGITYVVSCLVGARAGVAGVTIGIALALGLQTVMLWQSLKAKLAQSGIRFTLAGAAAERSVFTRFALPAALSGFTAAPALWLAQAILVRSTAGRTAEIAMYSASYMLMSTVVFLPYVVNGVGMSLLNHVRRSSNTSGYLSIFRTNLVSTIAIATTGALLVGLLGSRLLRLFGPDFEQALPVLLILLIATIPESLTIALNQTLQSRERLWRALFTVNVPRDIAIVVSAMVLTPDFGAVGLALSYMIGRVIGFVMMLIAVRQIGLITNDSAVRV